MRAGSRESSGPPISGDDLERLRYACGGKRIDATRSLFGPESVTWRVNREAALLLGGGCALLMQVAHPLVAAGVAMHSRFREEPLQRLWRTLDLTLTITFADAASALRAVRMIERVHGQVHGKLDAAVGPFDRGTPYDANDPQLLFWVHATLVDTALRVYERFVGGMDDATRAAYYDESKTTARLFGIPKKLIPRTYAEFQDYMQRMIEGDTLAVGPAGSAIADSILTPPLPIGLRQVAQSTNLFTIGLVPEPLRARYGFRWSWAQDVVLKTFAVTTPRALSILPNVMRRFPHARRAATAAVLG